MEGLKNTTDALTLFLMSIEVKIISAEQSGSKFDSGNLLKGNFEDLMIPLLKSVKEYTQLFIEYPGTSELGPKSALQCLAAYFILRQKEIKEDFINSSFPKSQANIFSIELALGIYSDLVDELCFMADKCPTLDSTVTPLVGDLSSRKADINLEKSKDSPVPNKPTSKPKIVEGEYSSSAIAPQHKKEIITKETQSYKEIYEGSYDSSAVAPQHKKETITKETQTSKDNVGKPVVVKTLSALESLSAVCFFISASFFIFSLVALFNKTDTYDFAKLYFKISITSFFMGFIGLAISNLIESFQNSKTKK